MRPTPFALTALAIALMTASAPLAEEPGTQAHDEMSPAPSIVEDCVPCSNDPWFWCCRSMSQVNLEPGASRALSECIGLQGRVKNTELEIAILKSKVSRAESIAEEARALVKSHVAKSKGARRR